MRQNFMTVLLFLLLGNAYLTASPTAFINNSNIPAAERNFSKTSNSPQDNEAPSIPVGLEASNITETSFDLTWTASTDNVGVFGYEVFVDGSWAGANTIPSLTITGLTAGTSYSIIVNAFDAATPANISSFSIPLIVTTLGTVSPDTEAPSIPAGLVASNITETSFDLAWNASTDNVGVFGYQIYQDGAQIGATTETSYSITGLSAAKTYSIKVDAFDTYSPANISAQSEALSVSTTGTVVADTEAPSIPIGLVASNITETSFDLTWTASTDNVGVFGYEVFLDDAWVGANTIPSISITGLMAGTTYSIKVNAFDTSTPANISEQSEALIVTTPGTVITDSEAPSIPTGLVASNITETSFDLSWTASTDNVAVFGYEVFKNGTWVGANTSPSLTITGLSAGTTYSFTVDAFDTSTPANVSEVSAPVSVTTNGIAVPDTENPTVPTGLVVSNITDTSFDLSWTASTDNVGVHGYEIYKNSAWAGATTETSITITGLLKGTTYSISVGAFDDANNLSSASAPVSVTTTGEGSGPDTEAPSVPTGLVASNITDTSFDLTWTASTDNVEVFGYEVFKNGVWVGANTIPTLTITGLSSGTTYKFTVNAFDTSNPTNISAFSLPLTVTTTGETVDSEAPSIPANLLASDVNKTSFTLTWSASSDNAGVAGYEVFKDGVYFGATTDLSINITGLNCGESYAFTVDAFDISTPSNISAASYSLLVSTLDCNTAVSATLYNDISIYPNPVQSVFFITNLPKTASISLLTIDGRVVREMKNEGNETIQVDASGFNKGVYFLNIKSENHDIIKKFIVK